MSHANDDCLIEITRETAVHITASCLPVSLLWLCVARAAAVIIIQSEELNVALSTAALDLGSFQVNVRQTSQCKPAAANTIIIRSQMEAVCTFMLGITTNIFTEGYDNDIHGFPFFRQD